MQKSPSSPLGGEGNPYKMDYTGRLRLEWVAFQAGGI